MNIYNKLKTIFSSLTVPCEPIIYSGTASTYVTYTKINKAGEAFANFIDEMATDYYVQIDIWSNTLQVDLEAQITNLLRTNCFYEITSRDLYDDQKRFDHTIIEATYIEM